ERARLRAGQPEAELHPGGAGGGGRREPLVDVGGTERQRRRVERRLGLVVLDEVAELRILLLADRLLQADRVLRHAQDLAHLLGRHLELVGDLVGPRLAPETLPGTPLQWRLIV